jgi:hypothetical protein
VAVIHNGINGLAELLKIAKVSPERFINAGTR